jgi:hypothetical protein
MSATLLTPNQHLTSYLPPDAFWLTPLAEIEKMQTPVDDRGLVIVDALIEGVKSYIDPAWGWPDRANVHHLYWAKEWYVELDAWSEGHIPARRFRELPSNKIYVPQSFHAVLHAVTHEPPMPAPEIMREQAEAWRVATNLFDSVANVLRAERLSRRRRERLDLTERERRIGEEYMQETLDRHFKGVRQHLGALSLVPEEFWPLNPQLPAALAAGAIGDVMMHGCQRRTKAVRRFTGPALTAA